MRLPAAFLAVVAMLLAATPARAADVLAPTDGATVSSRPDFLVDYQQGTLAVQFAAAPDVLTGGPNVGEFVEPARSEFMLVGVGGQPPFVAAWGRAPRLSAGRYFWHAQTDDYATEAARGFIPDPWGPTRTLVVRDEPIVFEGWTLRARRVSRAGCSARYRRAYLVSGTLVWNDNAETPAGSYKITLATGPAKTAFRGALTRTSQSVAQRVCTNHSTATATVRLTDPAGHVTAGSGVKQLRFR